MKNSEDNIKKLQELEIEILDSFVDFCSKNSLIYSLCGGTLLGAIRHKGFIPWDDDIDIMMPRPDYERFIELIKKNNSNLDRYRKVYCIELDQNCPSNCIRIYDQRSIIKFNNYIVPFEIGCWIDIFPLDGVEENQILRFIHFKMIRLYMDLLIICITRFGGKRRTRILSYIQYAIYPIVPLIRLIGYKFYLKKIIDLQKKIDYSRSKCVGVIAGRAGIKEVMLKQDMFPMIYVEFNGKKYTAIANYDIYLRNLYCDYMKLPPKEEQISRHEIKVVWK